ncbi:MAG TPA: 4Fe-4S single cluster domain-containing protein [Mycobacteriales bacterium]|nr:4Fe-4S single cluster domain-containing protein [Mycobacteriales bacterium]
MALTRPGPAGPGSGVGPAGGGCWQLHAVLPRSRANGPGARFTVWLQGCSLGCPGCFNPTTHPAGAEPVPVRETVAAALAERPGIDGVTLTGGEPLQQPAAVAEFCAAIRAAGDLGIIVLTGYDRAEIEADPARSAAVADADLVIAGRYERRRHLGSGLRGSTNKACWARTGRYRPADLAAVPETEIVIGVDGEVTVTGMAAAPALRRTLAAGRPR